MANNLDTSVGLFFEAGRIIRHGIERDKAPLSPTQLEAVRFIQERHAPSMRDLAVHLHITAPSATSVVHELVLAGNARRASDPKDRRQVRLGVTEKGCRTLERATVKRKAVLKKVLSHLSPRDHQDLQRILLKIIKE